MVLQNTELESPQQDQLGSLILFLQNLKDYMDCKPGLIVNWKDHENLVLFISYLNQNNIRGRSDEFSRNTLQLDVATINHEELNDVLISAQVIAFTMASRSLLKRYGKFHWWKLYSGTRECVAFHMRAGILKAVVLSSATPLTNEQLIAYAECVDDNIIELHRDWSFEPLKNQVNKLHEDLPFFVRLFINYSDEQEKLSHIKVRFQDWLRSLGSTISSCFSDWLKGATATMHNTTEISNLAEKMNLIMVETERLLHRVFISEIGRESPKVNQLASLNLLLENWMVLIEIKSDLIIAWKDQFQMIYENLAMFKSFITSSSIEDDKSQKLCSSILYAGNMAEYLLTTFSVGTCPVRCRDVWISEFMVHVKSIKESIMEVNEKKVNANEISTAEKDRSHVSSGELLVPTVTDLVVGLEVEMELIRKRLSSYLKQLDVISIIGMGGLGKTTLARKAYEDAHTINHFDIRAWCCISQEFNKKEVLLTILGSTSERKLSVSELREKVHKQLKGRRYLIVLDDIWDINAFMDLKCFFPDDNIGSRIMLTTRSKVIGSEAQIRYHSDIIEPRMLTDDQSWDLLVGKVNKEKCPPELCQIGKEIAKKCKGLPLAVVIVGGVLAKGSQTRDFWEQVNKNLSSYLARDSESQFMAALELSYGFLPDYLKPMFLYLGAYPEDEEILAEKLKRLWIAEGFVQKTDATSLESEAERNLMDLIDRSLLMVAKRRWDGSVKACHVHDLLREMCLAKSKEEKFMQQMQIYSELRPSAMYQRQQRLSILFKRNDENTPRHLTSYSDLSRFLITPPIYSLLFFRVGPNDYPRNRDDISPVVSNLKLLRVFDAEALCITQDVLDKDLFMLMHLRYLSISVGAFKSIPSSISQLRNLETLIIIPFSVDIFWINVPETIWEMTKLKHLRIDKPFYAVPDNSFILENLETLSKFYFVHGEDEKILRKVPALLRLKCYFRSCFGQRTCHFPNFECLGKLEKLSIFIWSDVVKCTEQFKLPLTLKRLKIETMRLEWSQVSLLQILPNLEVLKLYRFAAEDEYWDMGDDEVFPKLKLLKFTDLTIKRWSASSENFPCLEKVIFSTCMKLEEIPSRLGEIDTLREIQVTNCGNYLENLVKEIQTEQEGFGNDSLKFSFPQCKPRRYDW